jgi:hypothetical protein
MRRRAVIASIVVVAAALLVWRRRRARARAPLGAAPVAQPVTAPASRAQPAASPAPSGSRFVSVPWTLVAAPADRAELTLRYAVDPQLELDRVDAQETPTQVFVTVLMRPCGPDASAPAAPPQKCEATVPLSGPLGTRTLIHAPADPPVRAGGELSDPPFYP